MERADIVRRLRERFADAVAEGRADALDPWVTVRPDAIADVCHYLKDDQTLGFDALGNLSGVDYPKEKAIQVVYHLYSYRHRHAVILKVNADRDAPVVRSVAGVWRAANWLEREVFDLLGIDFEGHPDLRRLLMPEDWPGHPLRKAFVEPEEYHGIRTSRESMLK